MVLFLFCSLCCLCLSLASSNRSLGQFVFGSVNNTHLIPLLPRLPTLSCISLISSPVSNRPEGFSLFVCLLLFLFARLRNGPLTGKHQSGRFIFPSSEGSALYQIIAMVMDRVKNRSETRSNRGCYISSCHFDKIVSKVLSDWIVLQSVKKLRNSAVHRSKAE